MTSSPLRLVGLVLLRVLVMTVGWVAYDPVYSWVFYHRLGYRPIGADIGEGLLAFAALVVISALWAAWDGWRHSFGVVAATWVATAFVAGVLFVVLTPGDLSASRLSLRDVADQLPFLAGLVAVPAVLAGGLVALVRSPGRPVATGGRGPA